MRTLKALLCLSALAAGIATTVAQSNVYSLNIVGYVNKSIPLGFNIYCNPLTTGTNGAPQIFTGLPDNTYILVWNGVGFTTHYYDSTLGIDPGNWYDAGLAALAPPQLPPGKGFFMNPGTAFNNTFVGEVVPSPGTTNVNNVPNGFQLVGSTMPVAGGVAEQGAGKINLPLLDNMYINKWNGVGYTTHYYDSTLGIDPGNWYDAGLAALPPPTFTVGEGFFWNPGQNAQWQQWLP